MPALPNVPKVIAVKIFSAIGSDVHVLNTLHWQYAGTASQTDLDTFTETVENAWETNVLPLMTHSVTLEQVTCTDLSTTSSPQSTVVSGVIGGIAGSDLSAGTAMVVSRHIARRFRGGHSRFYLAGLPAADLQSPQTWTAASVAAMQAALVATKTAIAAYGGATMGAVSAVSVSYYQFSTVVINPITHRARNVPTIRPGGPLVDPVTTDVVSSKVASQRRRNLQSQ